MTAIKINEITIQNIGNWSLHIRIIILFLLSSGLLLCSFTIFLSNNYRQWETAAENYRVLKNEWVNKQEKMKHTHVTTQERKKLDDMWLGVIQMLGEPIPLADVLQDVEHLAHANQLDLKSVKQFSVKKQNSLTILPLQIIISGNIFSIKKFLYEMAKLKRAIVVDQFSWTSGNTDNSEIEMMLTANLFAYTLPLDIVNLDSKALTNRHIKNDQTISKFSTTDEKDKNESDIESLTSVSLDKINLSGIIRQNEEYLALLMTPDNRIHTAIVGNKIGFNGGLINKIDAKQVEVVELLPNSKQAKHFVFSLKNNLKK